jgi:hypothetical protein
MLEICCKPRQSSVCSTFVSAVRGYRRVPVVLTPIVLLFFGRSSLYGPPRPIRGHSRIALSGQFQHAQGVNRVSQPMHPEMGAVYGLAMHHGRF